MVAAEDADTAADGDDVSCGGGTMDRLTFTLIFFLGGALLASSSATSSAGCESSLCFFLRAFFPEDLSVGLESFDFRFWLLLVGE